jgi:hypothetical protein
MDRHANASPGKTWDTDDEAPPSPPFAKSSNGGGPEPHRSKGAPIGAGKSYTGFRGFHPILKKRIITRSKKAGLKFPVGRVHRYLKVM